MNNIETGDLIVQRFITPLHASHILQFPTARESVIIVKKRRQMGQIGMMMMIAALLSIETSHSQIENGLQPRV